jgi:glycosyltransferase involved in cell wall biosynthesis
VDKKIKLAYYLSHPIQYFSPLLRSLAEKTDLNVYYFSDSSIKGTMDKGFGQKIKWDVPLLQGYKSRFIRNFSFGRSMNNRFLDAINPGVISMVCRDKAGVIIVNGWSYFSTVLVIVAGKIAGKQIWLRSENPLNQESRKSRKIIFLKKLLLEKLLFRIFVDRFLYIGTESKKFFQFYGVPENKLLYTPYAVDNAFFQEEFLKYKDDLPALKAELHIPIEKKVLLFTGKFIAKKRPMDLLKVFIEINRPDWQLIMVGEGELRAEMEAFIRENNAGNVLLTGFVNQTVIPRYYSVADIFVMCSGVGETWGLAVNEAMNFAKPIVVSATCGCSVDLVREGINGFIFGEGDLPAFKAALLTMMENEADRRRMGEASPGIVDEFSIALIVGNISKAL